MIYTSGRVLTITSTSLAIVLMSSRFITWFPIACLNGFLNMSIIFSYIPPCKGLNWVKVDMNSFLRGVVDDVLVNVWAEKR